MTRAFLLLTLLTLFTERVSAQMEDFKIQGYVYYEDEEPAIGAHILLYRSDSTFMERGTVSDDIGFFDLDGLSARETYYLEIKTVGYETYTTEMIQSSHSLIYRIEVVLQPVEDTIRTLERVPQRQSVEPVK